MDFLSDDILLSSPLAIKLYNDFAKALPIIDYHCHINPEDILHNKQFSDITQLWLSADHYKWRLMRNCGIDERFITGNASSLDKFKAFAGILPQCIGNPIYIWCHLELKKYFGYSNEINSDTAEYIFQLTKEKLAFSDFSARNLIKRSDVKVICTTDDPADSLDAHKKLADEKDFETKVIPSFRPDKALNSENPGYIEYLQKLGKASGIEILNIAALKEALIKRLDFFVLLGCKVSDHALLNYTYAGCGEEEADIIFKDTLKGKAPDIKNAEKLRTFLLLFLAGEYLKRDIAMQLHFCCLRNNNTEKFKLLGPDTGFDCINASKDIWKLAAFLTALEKSQSLPKTIVYSLDPNDNSAINTIINCFQGNGIRGKLQHGSAWWFNDTECGMKAHTRTLAEYGVLGNFIGMLTDSRSFTSYIRHDYFRRIICDYIASQVNEGKYPLNMDYLKTLIQNICYFNVKKYLSI